MRMSSNEKEEEEEEERKTRWHTSGTQVRNAMRSRSSCSLQWRRTPHIDYDQLFEIGSKTRNRHYEIRHDQNSINAYQHVLLNRYPLGV